MPLIPWAWNVCPEDAAWSHALLPHQRHRWGVLGLYNGARNARSQFDVGAVLDAIERRVTKLSWC
jgi:hypothetical protein